MLSSISVHAFGIEISLETPYEKVEDLMEETKALFEPSKDGGLDLFEIPESSIDWIK